MNLPLNTTAAVAPIAPKKGEYAGHFSVTPEDIGDGEKDLSYKYRVKRSAIYN